MTLVPRNARCGSVAMCSHDLSPCSPICANKQGLSSHWCEKACMEGVVEAISCMEAHMTCTSAFCTAVREKAHTCDKDSQMAAPPRLLFLLGLRCLLHASKATPESWACGGSMHGSCSRGEQAEALLRSCQSVRSFDDMFTGFRLLLFTLSWTF